jgi:hypothetical protein
MTFWTEAYKVSTDVEAMDAQLVHIAQQLMQIYDCAVVAAESFCWWRLQIKVVILR